jgi:hypothetical protein
MASGSRRGFLKAASFTVAGLAASSRIPAWADNIESAGPVQVWSTFRDKRHAGSEPLAWKPVTAVAADALRATLPIPVT